MATGTSSSKPGMISSSTTAATRDFLGNDDRDVGYRARHDHDRMSVGRIDAAMPLYPLAFAHELAAVVPIFQASSCIRRAWKIPGEVNRWPAQRRRQRENRLAAVLTKGIAAAARRAAGLTGLGARPGLRQQAGAHERRHVLRSRQTRRRSQTTTGSAGGGTPLAGGASAGAGVGSVNATGAGADSFAGSDLASPRLPPGRRTIGPRDCRLFLDSLHSWSFPRVYPFLKALGM